MRGGRRPVRRPAPPPLPPPLRQLLLESYEPPPLLRAAGGPARTCQYIGGGRGKPSEWTFCGKRSAPGRSYCQEHVEICYQAGSKGGGGKEK